MTQYWEQSRRVRCADGSRHAMLKTVPSSQPLEQYWNTGTEADQQKLQQWRFAAQVSVAREMRRLHSLVFDSENMYIISHASSCITASSGMHTPII